MCSRQTRSFATFADPGPKHPAHAAKPVALGVGVDARADSPVLAPFPCFRGVPVQGILEIKVKQLKCTRTHPFLADLNTTKKYGPTSLTPLRNKAGKVLG